MNNLADTVRRAVQRLLPPDVRFNAWNENETGVPVIAIHGFGGSPLDFEVVVQHQKARHPLLALPLNDAHTLAPEAPYILFGYSMGGRAALQTALAHPQYLKGMILIGATAGIDDPAERDTRQHADAALAERIGHIGTEAFQAEWANVPIIKTQNQMPEPYQGQMKARRQLQPASALQKSLERYGQGAMTPLWSRLQEISAPTLLLTGEIDRKYSKEAQRLDALLPNATHAVVPGAGHAPHLETPEATSAILDRFLNGLERG